MTKIIRHIFLLLLVIALNYDLSDGFLKGFLQRFRSKLQGLKARFRPRPAVMSPGLVAINRFPSTKMAKFTGKVEQTFTCAKQDIVPKQLDRCWTHTTEDHVANTKTESITCCPAGYFCCDGIKNSNSGKPPCCPVGSACRTDGTCEIPKKIAECVAWGEPHYKTFDGQGMNYQGVCRMSLAKSHIRNGNSEKFEIFARNEYRNGRTTGSYVAYIELYIRNTIYRISRNPSKNPPVEVYEASGPAPVNMKAKGKPIDLSKTYTGQNVTITMLTAPAHTVYLSTDFGVEITYDGKWTAKIYLDERYKKHVTGFCGNYDDNRRDDLVAASTSHKGANVGKRASRVNEIGNSYIVNDVEPHDKQCLHKMPNVINPAHDLIIQGACRVIYDDNGPFAKCAAKLGEDRVKYVYDSCVYDGTQIGYPTVCENLKAFMDECTENRLPIETAYEPTCDLKPSKCF